MALSTLLSLVTETTYAGEIIGGGGGPCGSTPSFDHAFWICGDGEWSNVRCWSTLLVPEGVVAIFDGGVITVTPGSAAVLGPSAIHVRSGDVTIDGATIELAGSPDLLPPGSGLRVAGCLQSAALTLVDVQCELLDGATCTIGSSGIVFGGQMPGPLGLDTLKLEGSSLLGTGLSSLSLINAVLDLDDGSVDLQAVGTLLVDAGSVVTGNGTLACAVSNGGTITPGGAAPGLISITGLLDNQGASPGGEGLGGVIVVGIQGLTPVLEHDQLLIEGNAELHGSLVAEVLDGFAPRPSDSFSVVEASDVDGAGRAFDVVLVPALRDVALSAHVQTEPRGEAVVIEAGLPVPAADLTIGLPLGLAAGTPVDAALAQLDGDPAGRPELAVLLKREGEPGELLVLRNVRSVVTGEVAELEFDAPADSYPVGPGPSALALGDIEGDADIDLVVGNVPGPDEDPFRFAFVRPFVNLGDGSLQMGADLVTAPDTPDGLAIASMGSLGAPEPQSVPLVIGSVPTSSVVIWFLPYLLHPPVVIPTGDSPCSVEPVDVNQIDGEDLVVVDSGAATLSVFLADESGALAGKPAQVVNLPGSPMSVVTGDVDGDGLPDFVTAGGGGSGAIVRSLRGGLSPAAPLPVGDFQSAVAISDLESDGDLDLVLLSQSLDLAASIVSLRNDGATTGPLVLAQKVTDAASAAESPAIVLAGALSDDGRVTALLISAPQPGFGPLLATARPLVSPPRVMLFGDLDGDGAVSGADLGILLSAWETSAPLPDLDFSGTVDGGDLGLLLGAWTG